MPVGNSAAFTPFRAIDGVLAILNLVMTKTALAVYAAIDALLEGKDVKTLTIDQGREFVFTESLGAQWNAKTYACHAHGPGRKGRWRT